MWFSKWSLNQNEFKEIRGRRCKPEAICRTSCFPTTTNTRPVALWLAEIWVHSRDHTLGLFIDYPTGSSQGHQPHCQREDNEREILEFRPNPQPEFTSSASALFCFRYKKTPKTYLYFLIPCNQEKICVRWLWRIKNRSYEKHNLSSCNYKNI